MSSVTIALGSLLLMLLLIYAGLHVAITLGVLSFIGVWLIRDDVTVAANHGPVEMSPSGSTSNTLVLVCPSKNSSGIASPSLSHEIEYPSGSSSSMS